jgi:hypothetical protein
MYKGKGKSNDPNNWRSICLKELTFKVISSIVASRLLLVLYKNNIDEEFATVGCQEAIHILRAVLGLRRLHGKETFVLLVYLVKAFNTINHAILFGILLKYGIPDELIKVIECMYKDCKVEIKKGKEVRAVNYKIGVQQGDNVAPIIFIFVMLMGSTTFTKQWYIDSPEFAHFPSTR